MYFHNDKKRETGPLHAMQGSQTDRGCEGSGGRTAAKEHSLEGSPHLIRWSSFHEILVMLNDDAEDRDDGNPRN